MNDGRPTSDHLKIDMRHYLIDNLIVCGLYACELTNQAVFCHQFVFK